MHKEYLHWYCWWKKSFTTCSLRNPMKRGIFSISTGAKFLPSTVGSYPIFLTDWGSTKNNEDDVVLTSFMWFEACEMRFLPFFRVLKQQLLRPLMMNYTSRVFSSRLMVSSLFQVYFSQLCSEHLRYASISLIIHLFHDFKPNKIHEKMFASSKLRCGVFLHHQVQF